MDEQYSILRKFPTLEQAKELESILNQEGIETILADNVAPVDVTFSGSTLLNQIEVKIKQSDFKKAEELLEKDAEDLIDQVDKDYYLFDFTDEELYDILLKSDEWSPFDYSLAQKLLAQRGKSVDKSLLESLKKQRLNDLAKPEGNQQIWILAGYFFSILGGLLGILIGYSLLFSKKTLPDGQKVYTYNQNDRKHGKYILYFGIIVLPTVFLLRILN